MEVFRAHYFRMDEIFLRCNVFVKSRQTRLNHHHRGDQHNDGLKQVISRAVLILYLHREKSAEMI